jgi:hypothetical protein
MFFYNQAEVDGIKKNIADLWRQSSRNVLQMGLYLEDLRLGMPATDFSAYLKNEISRMGISRSTAYRWIVLSQELSILFPNRHVYEALVRLTSGRGIFAACTDSNAHLQEDWVPLEGMIQSLPAHLTPVAQEALSTLPSLPEEDKGESQAEEWAASFVKAMKEVRARRSAEARAARKTEAGQAKQRQAFLDKLHNLAASCSPEALREFREQLNQILDNDKDQHDAATAAQPAEAGPAKGEPLQNGTVAPSGPLSQSQVETGNPSPAVQVKEPDPASVPKTVSPSDKDRMQDGSAPASPNPVPTTKPLQSQVETGNPSSAVQAKESDPASAPKTVSLSDKDRMQAGPSSPSASPTSAPAAKPLQSQVGTGKRRRRRNRLRRKPAWLRESMNRPDQDRAQGGVSSAPASRGAVPAAKPLQSQVRTGPPSQPKEAETVFKSQPAASSHPGNPL